MLNRMPRSPRQRALIIGCGYFVKVAKQENEEHAKLIAKGKAAKGSHPKRSIDDQNTPPWRHVLGVWELCNRLITLYGYQRNEITVMTDDPREQCKVGRDLQQTEANIRRQMDALVVDARNGDVLFFFFGGHGGQGNKSDSREVSGFSQFIVPVDRGIGGRAIYDDDIHDRLCKPLGAGVKLNFFFMCCHSGSMADLPWFYDENGEEDTSYYGVEKRSFMDKLFRRSSNEDKDSMEWLQQVKEENTTEADIFAISASSDEQSAYVFFFFVRSSFYFLNLVD